MAADLHRIVQRMEKIVPNRNQAPVRRWLLLGGCLVLMGALVVVLRSGF